jgi:hypothetical protein
MVDIELDDSNGFTGLDRFLTNYGAALDREYSAAAGTAGEIVRGWLEDYTPRRSGVTATSWRVIAFGRNDYEISNTNEPIITFLTEGTRGHDIYGHPWLHWTDDDGFDHFAMHVWIPPREGIDIVGQALDAADPELDALWDAAEDAADRSVGFE